MKWISFLLALLLTISFIVIVENPSLITEEPVPQLGRFLSPFSGFWKNAAPDNEAFTRGSVINQQVTSPVTVQTDTMGVPHIFAEKLEDALYVQGYLTARDRLWQIDFSARATAGRLAELFGPELINYDQKQRKIGLARAARLALTKWQEFPEKMYLVERFCEGVNAYIDDTPDNELPVEYKLMGYKPEHWSPFKVALLFKGMAKTLNFGDDDIEMTNLKAALGDQAFDFLYPAYNSKQEPIVPDLGQWDSLRTLLAEKYPDWTKGTDSLVVDSVITHSPFAKRPPGVGSNNWAVSGAKTKSGKPILCNDPHLGLTFPSIWHMVQIHTPELNSMGVALAGIPGIIIGFNEQVAWGVTNCGQDVMDWYKIKWTNDGRTRYLLDGEEVAVQVIHDTILVKNSDPIIYDTKITHWGPVVYDGGQNPHEGMAMKWLSNAASSKLELDAFFGLMKAKNFDDYYEAVKSFTHPAQNIVFASNTGDIAIRVQGKLPIKEPSQGRFVQDGSLTKNDWKGYIPHDELPMLHNPQRGFVFSANQNSTPPSYPYYYNGGFADYRCRSIYNNLSKMQKVTVEDMMAMQNDVYNTKAADALPLMLKAVDTSELSAGGVEVWKRLGNWDYFFRKDAIEPAEFTEWFYRLRERTWDELNKLPKSLSVEYPEDWRLIELMSDTTHSYFDLLSTQEQEDFSFIATLSFGDMLEELAEPIASGKLAWKDYNIRSIRHLARIPAFSKTHLDVGGNANTINAMRGSFGPSWRMIVELTNPIKAYGLFPGGESGNPGSAYYDNMVSAWETGKYYELLFLHNLDLTDHQPFIKTEIFE